MLKNFTEKLYKDERGNYFVEMALALIVITLAIVTTAGSLTSQGITPKYNGINTELQSVSVPDLTP